MSERAAAGAHIVRTVRSGPGERVVVAGTISSAAFSSGDQFVIGHWHRSPVGPISDIMWLDPDDSRTLIASSDAAAELITGIYHFDRIEVAPLRVLSGAETTLAATDDLTIEISGGRLRPIPFPRPLFVTRYIEAPIARRLMDVETYGTSPTGAREWYQTRGWRWAVRATARHRDRDLGAVVDFGRPMNVGFSDPPRRASIVRVNVTIEPAVR